MSAFVDRAAWAAVLGDARALCGVVAAGGAADRDSRALFAGAVIRLKAPFPVRHASAETAAAAFLGLARGFVAAGFPAALAGFLAAGAQCLEAMIEAETRAAFAHSCRAAGEDGA